MSGKYILYNEKGIAKEYDPDDKLIFVGTYLKGKRNGKGKEYMYGKLIFEGEYLNGKKWNGKGKEYKNDKLIFEGEYLKRKRERIRSNRF